MPILATKLAATVVDVRADARRLQVMMADGREIPVPVEWFPRLRDASDEQRANWRLIGRGHGIHWPDIDEDISIHGLLRLT
jgi:hypothetical protein